MPSQTSYRFLTTLILVVVTLSQVVGTVYGQAGNMPNEQKTLPAFISNDQFVFHPSLYGYDVQAFLDSMPGILEDAEIDYLGERTTPAEIIEFYAYYYSINPQVLLTLLEIKSELVTDPNKTVNDLIYAMNLRTTSLSGFGNQVRATAEELSSAFYSVGNAQVEMDDGPQHMPEGAGAFAISQFLHVDEAMAASEDSDFVETYARLFGGQPSEPLTTSASIDTEPDWKLPWEYGHTWYFWAGPHEDGWASPQLSRHDSGALDFVPRGGSGCFDSSESIVAMAPGRIVYAERNLTVIDHGDNWTSTYYHVIDQDQVAADSPDSNEIGGGTRIGRPSCEHRKGGYSDRTHVHVSHVHNGQVQSAHGWRISGWEVRNISDRVGEMTREGVTKYSAYPDRRTRLSETELTSDNASDSDGDDISIGSNRTGTINPSGDRDDFYFNGTSGQTVTIRVNRSGNFDPVVALYAPNDTFIGQNDDDTGGSTLNSRLVKTLSSNGRYRIVVSGFNTSTGDYTLELQATNSNTGTNDPDDGRWIAHGQTHQGDINPTGDRDTYFLNGSAGTVISIRMTKQSGNLDSFLELYDASGSRIALNDDGGGSLNSWLVKELPANGTYRLVALAYRNASSGRYSLNFSTTYGSSSNLAINRGSTSSSVEFAGVESFRAFDGRTNTRWSSRFSDPQWVIVDMGRVVNFNRVVLRWEAAYARGYGIFVRNGSIWRQLYATGGGNGGIDTISFPTATGRYILMFGFQRGTPWGYSLWEMEVYNTSQMLIPLVPPDPVDKESDTLEPLAPLAPVAEGKVPMLSGANEFAQESTPALSDEAIPAFEEEPDTALSGIPYAEILDPSEASLEVAADTGLVTFEGYAVDNDEEGESIVEYEWISNLDGAIGSSSVFTLPITSLSSGEHVLSFRVQDDEGIWSEYVTRTVTIQPIDRVFLPSVRKE